MTPKLIRIGSFTTIAVVFIFLLTNQSSSHSTAPKPYLGLRYTSVAPLGVRVDGVRYDSPAALAGLQEGDVIYAVDGHYVNDGDLNAAIAAYMPEDVVKLSIKREGEKHTLQATLAVMPPHSLMAQNLALSPADVGRNGVLLETLHFDSDQGAWLVGTVPADHVLYDAGLREGDIVLSVDDHDFNTAHPESIMSYLLFHETAVLSVQRGSAITDIVVPARLALLLVFNL